MFGIFATTARTLPILDTKRYLNRACGLVGYPNVGKSTLFNAITQTSLAEAANYPFCTIDPNIAKNSRRTISGQVEIRDIAGIIKGAKDGEGMGNQFLSHIRGVNAILQVVRCFEDTRIAHVEDGLHLDPVAEFEAVRTELLLSDLDVAQKALPALKKRALNSKEAELQVPVYEKCWEALNNGIAPRQILTEEEKMIAEGFQLITAKPLLVVCNVDAESAAQGNHMTEKLIKHLDSLSIPHIILCAQLEFEVCMLNDAEFAAETLASYGLTSTALSKVSVKAKELLRLKAYYTLGEVEARSWFINESAKLPEAGAAIHTDFREGFTGAVVVKSEDVLKMGLAEAQAKKSKKGNKDYVVQEGDVIEFMDPKKKK